MLSQFIEESNDQDLFMSGVMESNVYSKNNNVSIPTLNHDTCAKFGDIFNPMQVDAIPKKLQHSPSISTRSVFFFLQ